MKSLNKAFFALLLPIVLLVGCAQIGLQPAQTFDEKVAYAYGSVTSLRLSAVNALNAGTIMSADADKVQTLADQARAFLDGARAVNAAGDNAGAEDKLMRASIILTELQKYMAAKGGGK